MSSNADAYACDTSFAVAALDASHEAHAECRHALIRHRPALAGHAAFETYSVLTRLPLPLRLTGPQAADVLQRTFPEVHTLSGAGTHELLDRLTDLRILGGAVYDALVGQAALSARAVLLTRDARAERTYRALGVSYEMVRS